MSYATWYDSLPPEFLTPEEKLAAVRKKFLPEPVITYSVLFGFTKSDTITADKTVLKLT